MSLRIRLRQVGVGALTTATAVASVLVATQVPSVAAPNVDVGSGNVVAEEFEHRNHGGGKLRLLLPFDCSASGTDRDYGFANMPSQWNNVVSSFKNYRGCDANHFDGTGFTGLSTGLADSTTYIGSRMDEKTSSIIFS